MPLETRRELLSDIAGDLKPHTPLIGLSDTLDTTPSELIPLVKEFGFEGIIAKRKDSCYESDKRSGAWLKYKVNKSQEFVIGGYTPDNPLVDRHGNNRQASHQLLLVIFELLFQISELTKL